MATSRSVTLTGPALVSTGPKDTVTITPSDEVRWLITASATVPSFDGIGHPIYDGATEYMALGSGEYLHMTGRTTLTVTD